jgi:hypothetical protein
MIPRRQQNHNIPHRWLNDYFNVVLAGVLILFLLLAYWFFLGPKFRATQDLIRANIAEQANLYVLSQRKLANLKAVAAVYQTISPADLQKFNGVLPDRYIPERLFGELEEIISSGGWLIKDISVSPAAPSSADEKLGQVNVELSLSGLDYIGFKKLLRLLENNLRLLDITSVDFSPGGNSATIIFTTYYYQAAG